MVLKIKVLSIGVASRKRPVELRKPPSKTGTKSGWNIALQTHGCCAEVGGSQGVRGVGAGNEGTFRATDVARKSASCKQRRPVRIFESQDAEAYGKRKAAPSERIEGGREVIAG